MKDSRLHKKFTRPVWYKSISDGFDFDPGSRKVSGYLAAFGNVDEDRDVIIQGAFAKSLKEHGVDSTSPRKIAFLYMHDMSLPLGRFTRLEEDSKGLYFEAELDPIELADQVLLQYGTGTLNQHSIGFRYVYDKLQYDEPTDTYVVKEVRLYEGSVVTVGANENTPFTGFKAADLQPELIRLQEEFERLTKSPDFTRSYEIKRNVSKMLALIEGSEPPQALVTPEGKPPKGIDWNKVAGILKV